MERLVLGGRGVGHQRLLHETVTYSGTTGTYRWDVYSYSGSGSFTLTTTCP